MHWRRRGTRRPCPRRASPRETHSRPVAPRSQPFLSPWTSAQAPGRPGVAVEKGDDGAVPCTQASALFSLGSSPPAERPPKRCKGYAPPSSWVLRAAGVGLAFSPGSSETACLPVPVLQKEVTNRPHAAEVLRISPDTKQNKNRRICLVCKANMYPVWCFWPYLSFPGRQDQTRESQAPRGVFTVLLGFWCNFQEGRVPQGCDEVGKMLARGERTIDSQFQTQLKVSPATRLRQCVSQFPQFNFEVI